MSEPNFFSESLQSFVFDVSCRGAIRHLCDLGYAPAEIRARLDYPVPLARIESELASYREEQERARAGEEQYTYVKEFTASGMPTFRRVRKEPANPP